MSAGIAIVYALYGSREAAEAAARDAVDRRLAACANILGPCRSIYIWEGARQEEDEVPVLFKTDAARREALMAHLKQIHDYDVPAVLSWDAGTTPDYARWVGESAASD
jgi:periplasmic divalent cation tolerance protein